MRWVIQKFEVLDSTNTFLYDITQVGTVVVASTQTAGRGRGSNSWSSPKGGLYFSALVHCGLEFHLYPLVCALCVRDALASESLFCDIKWPNDLLFEGKKVCGILCERKGANIILGIGINTNNNLDEGISFIGRGLNNDVVLQHILENLSARFGVRDPLEGYVENCVTIGKDLVLEDGTTGRAHSLSSKGCLLVQTSSGIKEVFSPVQIRTEL